MLPWWSIFSRKLIIESVEMTDWDMIVETWPSSPRFPNGRHNFPKFTRESKSTGPQRFTTTLRSMLASRGTFTYQDHGTPWGTAARDLRIQLSRGLADRVYQGRASFTDSTITIQKYEPFRASMQSRFFIDGSKLHFNRIDLASEGAQTVLTGDIDMGRWPEQTYQIASKIDFPTQKNIFFHRDTFTVSGKGDFQGTFHLFKGGRELKGTFASPLVGVNDWRFPDLRGSVLWLPDRMEVTKATSGLYGGTAQFDYRLAPLNKRDVPIGATWDVAYTDVDLAQLTDFLETKGLRLGGRATGRNHLDWKLGKWSEKRGTGEVVATAPPGVAPMTRELPPDLLAAAGALPPEAGPFDSHALARLPADRRPRRLHARSRLDYARPELGRDAEDLRRVRGADGVRRALADPVSRDEPRLARERSRARRHHDGVRLTDRRRGHRRVGTIRRRDAARLHEAAHRGHVHRRADAGLGHGVGTRHGQRGDREQLRDREREPDYRRELGDPDGRQVLARLPAARQRRGDQRARADRPPAARRPAACLRARRLPGRGGRLRRVSPVREVRNPVRLRPPGDRRRGRVRRAVRNGDRSAPLRGLRRASRCDGDPEEHRHDYRGRMGRLGRQLLVQRRRRAHSGRVAEDGHVPAGAAVGPAAVHRDRDRHVRRAALRRQGARGRPVRRRGRDRPAHRAPVDARRGADRRARSGLSPAGGLRIGPDCADRADGRRS